MFLFVNNQNWEQFPYFLISQSSQLTTILHKHRAVTIVITIQINFIKSVPFFASSLFVCPPFHHFNSLIWLQLRGFYCTLKTWKWWTFEDLNYFTFELWNEVERLYISCNQAGHQSQTTVGMWQCCNNQRSSQILAGIWTQKAKKRITQNIVLCYD